MFLKPPSHGGGRMDGLEDDENFFKGKTGDEFRVQNVNFP